MKADLSTEPTEPFEPPADPVFQHLLEQAVNGGIPVFGIVVSTDRLIAFDPAHRPELNRPGSQIVQGILRQWAEGAAPQPWVYPRGNQFVVSDDYFALTAIRLAKVGTIACQCLGIPARANVLNDPVPVPASWVQGALGIKVS